MQKANRFVPGRSWLRFGLRSLLIATLVSSLFFGWLGQERRREKFITQFVQAGDISFAYQERFSYRTPLRWVFGSLISREVDAMHLNYAHLTDEDMRGVEMITEVKLVDVIDNPITDIGLGHIRSMRRLEELYIGGQYARDITDAGVSQLGRLRNLRVLELRRTGVRGSGLASLAKLPKLRSLSLWNSLVDDSAIPHLKKLTQLEKLVLGRNNLSREAIEELRASLPNCLIVDDV